MTTPRVYAELPEFDPDSRCPACGTGDAETRYRATTYGDDTVVPEDAGESYTGPRPGDVLRINGVEVMFPEGVEHFLLRWCTRCRFAWPESVATEEAS